MGTFRAPDLARGMHFLPDPSAVQARKDCRVGRVGKGPVDEVSGEQGQTLFLIKKVLWLWAGIARVPLALCACVVVLPLIGRPLASLIRYFSSSYRLAGGMWQRPVV